MSQATHLVIPGVLMDDPMSIFWMAFDDVKVETTHEIRL